MGSAFLALYTVTGNPSWLDRATSAAQFINANFKSDSGFSTSSSSSAMRPTRQLDENIALVRFGNLLNHYSGDTTFREMAEHAMRHLAAPGIAERRGFQVGGILLADRELSAPPLHITVVGSKNDPAARSLFLAALKQPATYKRVEWLDETEGPLKECGCRISADRSGRGVPLHRSKLLRANLRTGKTQGPLAACRA